jgi:CubicO group peptidase (beta-lactamase class C family)
MGGEAGPRKTIRRERMEKSRFILPFSTVFTLGAAVLLSCTARVGRFETTSPKDAGFSAEKLEAVERYLEESRSAAFLALYDGKVFISWGEVNRRYPVHSIRKAFLSALYGIHVERGTIDLYKNLRELDIDDIPPSLTEEEKDAKVIDLIQSRSGVYHVAAAEAPEMVKTRPERGSHPPGTFFYYNNWDFNVLGTIFEQETGEDIFEAFSNEIAQPLGMRDFQSDDGLHLYERDKSVHPAYHFWMSAHDMALFGLLYQRNGVWDEERIVPEDWIRKSTTAYSVVNEQLGLGYGYMWYVLTDEEIGHAFFHTGAGVHLLGVFPQLKLVLVHRVDTERPYNFTGGNLIQLWNLIFDARL